MNFEIKELSDFNNPETIWQNVVNNTSCAWFWSTYEQHRFRITVSEASGRLVEDKSFVLLQEGKPCGLSPLVFIKAVDFEGIQASYNDCPLPWPMVIDSINDQNKTLDYLFEEMEFRINDAGVGLMQLMLSPPGIGTEYEKLFVDIVKKRNFLDSSSIQHYIPISSETLDFVRKRYRRYVNKFFRKYELSILTESDCYQGLAREYMDIHVKDAEGVYRPIATYDAQINLIRNKEGFLVQARDKANDKVVGMLIISCFKNSAYDNSVAVDPKYQEDYISHLMKWKAIQHLQEINVNHYELGGAAISPTYLWQPTPKNYGISFFKEGWSRGYKKKMYIAVKYYSRISLEKVWNRKLSNLLNYFKI